MRAALLLAAIVAGSGGLAQASDWRPAEAGDVRNSGDWKYRKDRTDRALSVAGDFDGDGRQDRAEFSVNDAAQKFGLFVHLANGEVVLLAEHLLSDLPTMGIAMRPRGTYPTFCGRLNESRRALGKRDKPCGVPAIELKSDGIDLFTYEKSAQTFYWKDGAFVSAGMSD